MTRIRNVSPLGDLIIGGVAVAAGEVIDTDDKTLVESEHFERAPKARVGRPGATETPADHEEN